MSKSTKANKSHPSYAAMQAANAEWHRLDAITISLETVGATGLDLCDNEVQTPAYLAAEAASDAAFEVYIALAHEVAGTTR